MYFLFPETGYRSLEEVDVIFHAASLSPNPWLNVRKIAANEPLWYGKDGEEPFDYEGSEWHKRHVRFSDEIKDSDGGTTTLRGGEGGTGSGNSTSPTQWGDGGVGKVLSSDEDEGLMGEKVSSEEGEPRNYGADAAPSPVISRTSRDRASRDRGGLRSAGRGY